MKITIFGLTLSSSWGNGHATPYRSILRALHRRGVELTFYEKDTPYYAQHRDFNSCGYCDLQIYSDWPSVRHSARRAARDSDVVIVASYCYDGARIADEILAIDGPLHVFYDLDTPITLHNLTSGPLDYLRCEQIPEFDLYLSFTGGKLLQQLENDYGARMARPLYGCVDPDEYRRVPSRKEFQCALSYVATYAEDRQQKLEQLFLDPARQLGATQFVLAGSLYPDDQHWPANVKHFPHIASDGHAALYSSSRATLNLTRQRMAESGYCPSGRFFEAAACATPILTDFWQGLDRFFDVRSELCVVRTPDEVLAALGRDDADLTRMGKRARTRTLEEHTGDRRAAELLAYCEEARHGGRLAARVTA